MKELLGIKPNGSGNAMPQKARDICLMHGAEFRLQRETHPFKNNYQLFEKTQLCPTFLKITLVLSGGFAEIQTIEDKNKV